MKQLVQLWLNLVGEGHGDDARQDQGGPRGDHWLRHLAVQGELDGVGEEELRAADHVDDGGGGHPAGGDEEEGGRDAGDGDAQHQQPVLDLHGVRG